jgi:hypothetical protein
MTEMRQQNLPRLARAAAALLWATVLAVACDSASNPGSREPAAIAVVSGGGQTGAAGQELAQPVAVKVTDAGGRPVAGQAVTFHVTSGGGSVFSGSASTNAEGIAQERWTLGTAAGTAQTLEARVVNGSGTTLTAVASATITAAPPAHLDRVTPGGTLGGVVNSVLADTLAVRVTDAFGNPVPGATVTWAVVEGGGSTAAGTSVADANGIARMTWTLGPATNVVQHAAASIAGGAAVDFPARAASAIQMLNANGAAVLAGVPIDVRVALLGGASGPVPGVTVQWQATSGSVSPAVSKTEDAGAAYGTAATQWTPGPAPGPQTLTATAGGLQATLTVNVIPAGSRTLVAQVPGPVLDATTDRALWLDAQPTQRLIKIRTLASGADVVVKADSAATVTGYLYSAGAIVSGGNATWFEYRNGTLTSLGPVQSGGLPAAPPLSVEGEWAAWSSGTQVIRRDLSTGTNAVISGQGAAPVDVGPNGDVVYFQSATGGFLYHAGTTTPVSVEPGAWGLTEIQTDGVNVTYVTYAAAFETARLFLENGASDILLAAHSAKTGGVVRYRLNGGWIAWSTPSSATTRRSPAGAVQQVSPETSGTQVEALGPDGTVIYRYPTVTNGHYFLVTPGGTRYDLGPAVIGERIVVRNGVFLLISADGSTVYRLSY